jgi:hypothetical protein
MNFMFSYVDFNYSRFRYFKYMTNVGKEGELVLLRTECSSYCVVVVTN